MFKQSLMCCGIGSLLVLGLTGCTTSAPTVAPVTVPSYQPQPIVDSKSGVKVIPYQQLEIRKQSLPK